MSVCVVEDAYWVFRVTGFLFLASGISKTARCFGDYIFPSSWKRFEFVPVEAADLNHGTEWKPRNSYCSYAPFRKDQLRVSKSETENRFPLRVVSNVLPHGMLQDFEPEDGSSMIRRNVDSILPSSTTSRARRQSSEGTGKHILPGRLVNFLQCYSTSCDRKRPSKGARSSFRNISNFIPDYTTSRHVTESSFPLLDGPWNLDDTVWPRRWASTFKFLPSSGINVQSREWVLGFIWNSRLSTAQRTLIYSFCSFDDDLIVFLGPRSSLLALEMRAQFSILFIFPCRLSVAFCEISCLAAFNEYGAETFKDGSEQ